MVVPALASLEPPPGGSGEYEEGAFVWLPLWRLLSAAPGWGKGVVVWAENPPPLSFPELGLRGPRGRGDVDGENWRPLRPGERVTGELEARSPSSSSSHCALGITAPPASALLFPTPTGLRPLWFDSFAFPAFIRPAPGPVLAVCGPLLFEFRLGTEGAFVDVRRSGPCRPGRAGREVGMGARRLSLSTSACLVHHFHGKGCSRG